MDLRAHVERSCSELAFGLLVYEVGVIFDLVGPTRRPARAPAKSTARTFCSVSSLSPDAAGDVRAVPRIGNLVLGLFGIVIEAFLQQRPPRSRVRPSQGWGDHASYSSVQALHLTTLVPGIPVLRDRGSATRPCRVVSGCGARRRGGPRGSATTRRLFLHRRRWVAARWRLIGDNTPTPGQVGCSGLPCPRHALRYVNDCRRHAVQAAEACHSQVGGLRSPSRRNKPTARVRRPFSLRQWLLQPRQAHTAALQSSHAAGCAALQMLVTRSPSSLMYDAYVMNESFDRARPSSLRHGALKLVVVMGGPRRRRRWASTSPGHTHRGGASPGGRVANDAARSAAKGMLWLWRRADACATVDCRRRRTPHWRRGIRHREGRMHQGRRARCRARPAQRGRGRMIGVAAAPQPGAQGCGRRHGRCQCVCGRRPRRAEWTPTLRKLLDRRHC